MHQLAYKLPVLCVRLGDLCVKNCLINFQFSFNAETAEQDAEVGEKNYSFSPLNNAAKGFG